MTKTILILGGTAEARSLADQAVAQWPDARVVTSLAGRTKSPRLPRGEIETGGFGGADGLADYLVRENVDVLIDATHPFAAEISRNAERAAAGAGVPRLVLARPPWSFAGNTNVRHVPDLPGVHDALASAVRIFLAIGRQEVAAFAPGTGKFFLLRFIDPPASPPNFAGCRVLTGRPESVAEETNLLQSHRIDTVVAKNGGSDASRAKIDAALALGLSVILIDPPPPPMPPRAGTVDAAINWIAKNI
ncbi:MAG: cobalt-precorrin-6A reductase [Rhodospirillaceae bacterium]